jgi:hypothetical protein
VLTERGRFRRHGSGQAAFCRYLANSAKSIFTLLANVSEEGFHIETIPFLRGEDRETRSSRASSGSSFFNAR